MFKGIVLIAFFIVGGYTLFSQSDENYCPIPDTCLFVPNVATVDCARLNGHLFGPFFGCSIYNYHLVIYNRWGELVFESTEPKIKWDTSGFPDGVYIWQITGTMGNQATPNSVQRQGRVTVLK